MADCIIVVLSLITEFQTQIVFRAGKHNTAIYEQNSSKPTCFTEAAEAIAMLSRFSRLLFVVLGWLIQT